MCLLSPVQLYKSMTSVRTNSMRKHRQMLRCISTPVDAVATISRSGEPSIAGLKCVCITQLGALRIAKRASSSTNPLEADLGSLLVVDGAAGVNIKMNNQEG